MVGAKGTYTGTLEAVGASGAVGKTVVAPNGANDGPYLTGELP